MAFETRSARARGGSPSSRHLCDASEPPPPRFHEPRRPVSPYSDHYDHLYPDYYDCRDDPSCRGDPCHDDGRDRVYHRWPSDAYGRHRQAYPAHLDDRARSPLPPLFTRLTTPPVSQAPLEFHEPRRPVNPGSDRYDHRYPDYHYYQDEPSRRGAPRPDDGRDRLDGRQPLDVYDHRGQAYRAHLDDPPHPPPPRPRYDDHRHHDRDQGQDQRHYSRYRGDPPRRDDLDRRVARQSPDRDAYHRDYPRARDYTRASEDARYDRYHDHERYPDHRRYRSPPHHDIGDDYRADRYDDRDRRHEDHSARILKGIRAVDLVFYGSRGPRDYIDWESAMNSYFRYYRMDDDLCVEYVETRLGGHAKIFWEDERHAAYRRGQPITSWIDMAQRLRNKYVPREYESTSFPRQGPMPIREHMEHMVRPTDDFDFSPSQPLTRVAPTRSSPTTSASPIRSSIGNGRTTPEMPVASTPSRRPPPADAPHDTTTLSQVHTTCFKCLGKGHCTSQCPLWNLLLEVKGLDRGSHEDDLPSGDDVYLADEALADECDDTSELIDHTPIRPAAPAAVEAPAPASTLTSTPMRDMISVAIPRSLVDVILPPPVARQPSFARRRIFGRRAITYAPTRTIHVHYFRPRPAVH